jgi:hypothetical protein
MKPQTTVRSVFMIILAVVFINIEARSQDESDLIEFLNAGKNDASKMIGAYISPVVEGISYGMNGGWYHTAKAHKSLGFDIGVSVNTVFIPSSRNYFDPNALELETLTSFTSDAPNGLAPTMVGPKDHTTYTVNVGDTNNDGQDETATFDGPEGLDFEEQFKMSAVLAPTAQIGIGIYKNTEIKFRFMPEVESGASRVKLFGLGILHDIKQHIPAIKLLPFDLAIVAGFTKVDGETGIDGVFNPSPSDTRPQILNYSMNAWLIQALISKKISVVTFYGGIGYNSIKTTADVTGSYVVEYDNDTQVTFTDPVSLEFKNNSFRLTAGVRFKFGPIYLNGDYSFQEFNTVSVGLGVTVR